MELLQLATGYLKEKGIASPRLDAEVLLGHVLGLDRVGLYVQHDKPLEPREVTSYRELIARRGQRMPVAQIVREKEFYSLAFEVTGDVLTPRPETELLVDGVREWAHGQTETLRIVDVGTGSGVLAVTLAKYLPTAQIWAIDASKAALQVAARNARRHGVDGRITWVHGEWLAPFAQQGQTCHVVVSNPPYIPTGELVALAPEVASYEPRLALDGGADGLVAYRRLLPQAAATVEPGGVVALEVGAGQAQEVAALGTQSGFAQVAIRRDAAGIERVVWLEQGAPA